MDKYDVIESLILGIEEELKWYQNYCSKALENNISEIGKLLESESQSIKDIVADELMRFIHAESVYTNIYLYSFIINISSKVELFEQFIQYVYEQESISAYTKYFLTAQFRRVMFLKKDFETENTKSLTWKLLMQVAKEIEKELQMPINRVKKEERDPDMVVVLTDQILAEQHGPTKTTLERCRCLIKDQNKKVVLINSNDLSSLKGMVPVYNTFYANTRDDLQNVQKIEWKEVIVPYYQCVKNGMTIEQMRYVITAVKELKPSRIIVVGGGNLLAYFLDKLVPAVTVGLWPSDLDVVTTSYQTLSVPLTEQHKRTLEKVGISKNHVIQNVFTSGFKLQESLQTREQLGLPNNKFIIVAVGGRLDIELQEPFFDMILKVLDDNTVLACCGPFRREEEILEKYPEIKGKFYCLGMQDDMLAVLDNVDLYINPDRKGGGTSCVEAMYKGVPVVALEYGDVAVNVGEEFVVGDYEKMIDMVHRYKNDKAFYGQQVIRAQKRAKSLMDTNKHLIKLMEEVALREDNGIV